MNINKLQKEILFLDETIKTNTEALRNNSNVLNEYYKRPDFFSKFLTEKELHGDLTTVDFAKLSIERHLKDCQEKKAVLLQFVSYENAKRNKSLSGELSEVSIFSEERELLKDVFLNEDLGKGEVAKTTLIIPSELADIIADIPCENIMNYYARAFEDDDIISISSERISIYENSFSHSDDVDRMNQPGISLKEVTNCINSYCHNRANFLDSIKKPQIRSQSHFIGNTVHSGKAVLVVFDNRSVLITEDSMIRYHLTNDNTILNLDGSPYDWNKKIVHDDIEK